MNEFKAATLLFAETAKDFVFDNSISGEPIDILVVLDIINKATIALKIATEIMSNE